MLAEEGASLPGDVKDELAEMRLSVARIEKDIETIKVILARHEATLERLAETPVDKIEFKRQ